MTDPFLIRGPALVSFSGGRTSAYLLRRILDSSGGRLPPETAVAFANTGKERPETLEFVRRCGQEWDVPIHWVEYGRGEVAYETASREGEPFAAMIQAHHALPNGRMRFCTHDLKLKPLWALARAQGWEAWLSILGIRADEPRRVAKIRGRKPEEFEDVLLPLVPAGVTEGDVLAFWRAQPFDLGLHPSQSNCDLCFLKGAGLRRHVLEREPERARWWIDQEDRMGQQFTPRGRPTYRQLLQLAGDQLPLLDEPDTSDCICGD